MVGFINRLNLKTLHCSHLLCSHCFGELLVGLVHFSIVTTRSQCFLSQSALFYGCQATARKSFFLGEVYNFDPPPHRLFVEFHTMSPFSVFTLEKRQETSISPCAKQPKSQLWRYVDIPCILWVLSSLNVFAVMWPQAGGYKFLRISHLTGVWVLFLSCKNFISSFASAMAYSSFAW